MLWLKALHIIAVVSWFAGLLYLPRLFVYHTGVTDDAGHERFCVMEKKLYGITTIGMVLTWIFGIGVIMSVPAFAQTGWFALKLVLVIALSGYHGWLKVTLKKFAAKTNTRSDKFYRLMNEVPAVLLVVIVILVVVKPF